MSRRSTFRQALRRRALRPWSMFTFGFSAGLIVADVLFRLLS